MIMFTSNNKIGIVCKLHYYLIPTNLSFFSTTISTRNKNSLRDGRLLTLKNLGTIIKSFLTLHLSNKSGNLQFASTYFNKVEVCQSYFIKILLKCSLLKILVSTHQPKDIKLFCMKNLKNKETKFQL